MTKILLVEDNEMNMDMLSRRLRSKGYTIEGAEDGEIALRKAASFLPDVILMDMSLPKIDGWEATRRLKATPDLAAIPIIALTAHSMSGDREKALEVGCNSYASKPINFPELLQLIEKMITGKPHESI